MKIYSILICFCFTSTFLLAKTKQEKELLGGCWFIPHGATINIKFKADNTFVFNDYNIKLNKDERLTGKYLLVETSLYLIYDDRPKQKASFYLRKIDNSYIIRIKTSQKGYADYLFIHGECE